MNDEKNMAQAADSEPSTEPARPDENTAPAASEPSAPAGDTPQDAKPPRKPRPLWQKLLAVFAAALVVLLAAAFLYINSKLDLIHYSDGTVDEVGTIDAGEDQDLDTTGLETNNDEMYMPEGSPFQDDDVLNILLISTDERTDAVNDWDAFTHLNQLDGTRATTEFSDDARADSLILCSLNIREDTIKLVSIERATGVPILLDGYEGQYDWITHTFRYGGAKLTMDTVEDCFNVQVDHYVRFNFNSFVQIVDAVGGVDIRLTEEEAKALNWEVPSNSMLIVNKVQPGLNHFDGYTALQYARLRAIDDDWHRIQRQRTVIQAVLNQIKSASITELNDLLDAALPLVQTNFTKTEIAALMLQLPGFLGVTAQQMSLPAQGTYGVRIGMDDRSMYDPDWAENIRLLHQFLYGRDATRDWFQTPESAEETSDGEETADSDAWSEEEAPADSDSGAEEAPAQEEAADTGSDSDWQDSAGSDWESDS
ncbi:MAG: LCP family protein [Gemmiger sp.]|uniref:LCP family protein n=1 Tax=Gemmiger sp. TaxID=2049027 RepID=UPI002E75A7A2|nr:LCP family protein [Gemmiger sp.]MEE0800878.1 LCP family protein [Gemmiger sp.]